MSDRIGVGFHPQLFSQFAATRESKRFGEKFGNGADVIECISDAAVRRRERGDHLARVGIDTVNYAELVKRVHARISKREAGDDTTPRSFQLATAAGVVAVFDAGPIDGDAFAAARPS